MRADLRSLRLHFLAAMGLSCNASTPARPEGPAEIVVASVDAGPVAPAPAPPPRCGADESPVELRLATPCEREVRLPEDDAKELCPPLRGRPVLALASKTDGECMYHACVTLAPRSPPSGIPGPGGSCCVPMPQASSSRPAGAREACPVGLAGDLAFTHAKAGRCCYENRMPERHYRGRPVRRDGAPLLAGVEARDDWSAGRHAGAGEGRDWLAAAAMEHASIASFAQLSLALLSHGAPPDLLRDCHLAAIDEIAHASASYALAAKGDTAFGPGPLVTPPPDLSMATLVRETVRDGCLGETLAALEAATLAARAPRGAERDLLARIAEDELRHAALAFRILAWATTTGHPDVAPSLSRARAGLEATQEDRDVIDEVVLPCLDALTTAPRAA